jgi:hypothetical protein
MKPVGAEKEYDSRYELKLLASEPFVEVNIAYGYNKAQDGADVNFLCGVEVDPSIPQTTGRI